MNARWWRKVDLTQPDACWHWIASKTTAGYGCFYFRGRLRLAHRAAYEHYRGPVPDGFEIDHLCRNRACVNPWHLEPVTHLDNVRRGESFYGARTHCMHGHPFTPENTYRTARQRFCRACGRRRSLAYLARKHTIT